MRVRETIWAVCAASLSVLVCLPMPTSEGAGVDSDASHGASVGLTTAAGQTAILSLPARSLKDYLRGPSLSVLLTGGVGLQSSLSSNLFGRIAQTRDLAGCGVADASLFSLHCLLVV